MLAHHDFILMAAILLGFVALLAKIRQIQTLVLIGFCSLLLGHLTEISLTLAVLLLGSSLVSAWFVFYFSINGSSKSYSTFLIYGLASVFAWHAGGMAGVIVILFSCSILLMDQAKNFWDLLMPAEILLSIITLSLMQHDHMRAAIAFVVVKETLRWVIYLWIAPFLRQESIRFAELKILRG